MELFGKGALLGDREAQSIPNGDDQPHAKRRHNDPRACRKLATGCDAYSNEREPALPSGPSNRRVLLSIAPAMPTNSDLTAKQTTHAIEGPRTVRQTRAARKERCPKRHRLSRSRCRRGGSFDRTRRRAFRRWPRTRCARQARSAASRTTRNGQQSGKGCAHQHGAYEGCQRDLIGGHARFVETGRDGSQRLSEQRVSRTSARSLRETLAAARRAKPLGTRMANSSSGPVGAARFRWLAGFPVQQGAFAFHAPSIS